MSLTGHLNKKTYLYDAVVSEAPLLLSHEGKVQLGFDCFIAPLDLTDLLLAPAGATLVGTAFDELQRHLIMGEWSKPPSWRRHHYETHPILPKLRRWAYQTDDLERAALLLAFFDQMRRSGTKTVTMSNAYGHLFLLPTVDDFFENLPPELVPTLRHLRALNADTIVKYQQREPRIAGPSFKSGWLIGGADADGIYGRTLVELKTTKTLNTSAVRSALLQALAYALLDTKDQYELESIEVWFAKQNYTLDIPLSAIVPDLPAARARVKEKLILGMGAKTEAEARRIRKEKRESRRAARLEALRLSEESLT